MQNQNKQLHLFPSTSTDNITSMASSVKVSNSTQMYRFFAHAATCQIEHRNGFAFVEMAVL